MGDSEGAAEVGRGTVELGDGEGLSRLCEVTSIANEGCMEADVAVEVGCAGAGSASILSRRVSASGSLDERASGPVGDGCGDSDMPSYEVDSWEWDSEDELEAVDDGKAGDGGLGSGEVRGGGRE